MHCPHCQHKAHHNGTAESGKPRWRCRACAKSWVENPAPVGRAPKSAGVCPHCQSDRTKKNGDRALCRDCGRTFKF